MGYPDPPHPALFTIAEFQFEPLGKGNDSVNDGIAAVQFDGQCAERKSLMRSLEIRTFPRANQRQIIAGGQHEEDSIER